MKHTKKLVALIVMLLVGSFALFGKEIELNDYNDDLLRNLEMNYDVVASTVDISIMEDVAIEYEIDGMIIIGNFSDTFNKITISVKADDYNKYLSYLETNNISDNELLERFIKIKNTDNLFGAKAIYK